VQYGDLADGNEDDDDEAMVEEEEEEQDEHTHHRHHASAYARRRGGGGPPGMARAALPPPLPVQKAVQPGSTVSATSGAERQWLAYNMLGCAARRVESGGSGQATVEV